MKVLLIIDMQKLSFIPETLRFDTEGVVERINQLSAIFRKNGDKAIFIQHDGTKEGFCIPGTEVWEILSSLKIDSSDLFISKTANDSFYKTKLKSELKKMNADELIITGCATDFCVDSTVKSALTHDYNITVIKDGHTTADRTNLTAKQVIDHYNWVWKEMTPTKGKIEVLSLKQFIMKRGGSVGGRRQE